jgi:hypothetical protein
VECGCESETVQELERVAEALTCIKDLRVVVVLVLDKPYPDLSAVVSWLRQRPHVVRLVQLRLERSPSRLFAEVKHVEAVAARALASSAGAVPFAVPSPGGGFGGRVSVGGAAAVPSSGRASLGGGGGAGGVSASGGRGRSGSVVTFGPVSGEEGLDVDPMPVLNLLRNATAGELTSEDFLPLTALHVIEFLLEVCSCRAALWRWSPASVTAVLCSLQLLGVAKMSARPHSFCGFATILLNTEEYKVLSSGVAGSVACPYHSLPPSDVSVLPPCRCTRFRGCSTCTSSFASCLRLSSRFARQRRRSSGSCGACVACRDSKLVLTCAVHSRRCLSIVFRFGLCFVSVRWARCCVVWCCIVLYCVALHHTALRCAVVGRWRRCFAS